ncbi:MAG: AAA family ATPase [Methanobacteriota archaeon]
MINRNIYPHLVSWKQKNRAPLLIRGARQVGKSYIIQKFGEEEFRNTLTINFELRPDLIPVFESLDPDAIISQLQLLFRETIDTTTLLFFDEIQECPQAIRSLRYFKENRPDLFIIGAGSLLEFAFLSDMRMPVGRIQFLNLYPLSFYEFLLAIGEDQMVIWLRTVELGMEIPSAVHEKILSLLRRYLILGGMPEVIASFSGDLDLLQASYIQDALIETFKRDFGKYSRSIGSPYLHKVFDAIPRMVGDQIKFVNIDRDSRSRDLKLAMELLTLARVITRISCTDASGLPLGSSLSNRQKYLFLDVGLMQHICGIEADILKKAEIIQINRGSVAEQYVGQELLANADPNLSTDLFFWARDKPGSSSEVDYCIARGSRIYPVEVKSGKTGRLRSLRVFLEEKESPFGIRFWEGGLSFHDNILSVPLYMTGELDRLLQSMPGY